MSFIEWRKLAEMYNPVLFKDRLEGGKKLALKLKGLDLENPVVLAVPSGGVPVGIEVTKKLSCPFDLVVVRKIQFPWTTEAGFGAVAEDGTSYLGPGAEELSCKQVKIQTQKAIREVNRRGKEFLKGRKRVDVAGKTVILIDDGLATGSTMLCATESVKKENPAQIVVAAPTASGGAVELLEKETDKVITLYEHPKGLPFAVASSYEKWHDLTDEEVKHYLEIFDTYHKG